MLQNSASLLRYSVCLYFEGEHNLVLRLNAIMEHKGGVNLYLLTTN